MPVLQLDDQQFPLKTGATRIGAGEDADVIVPGYSAIPVEAVIDGGPTPTIRRADDGAHVRVNGVLLGAEPTPLMHGDKVEIAGLELRYSDDSKGGATQFVSASDVASLMGAKRGIGRATSASGGRLVSLVDGKEYSVPDAGVVFGRDASCDVVVAQSEVSRRHAEIIADEQGYMVRDTSANGLYVNGERVQGSHRLARADVLRIGTEEFRFYADLKAATAQEATPASPAAEVTKVPDAALAGAPTEIAALELLPASSVAAAPPRIAPRLSPPPPSPVPQLNPTRSGPAQVPTTPIASPTAKDPRPVVAVLESMNEGPGKGTKWELRTPLGHVGRGAHNDVRLSDESVSETHAKLQRREDGWYVVDMDSTNGTYVGGTRVNGERRIEGSPDVRFGGMKFRFSAVGAGNAADLDAKGTRAIATMRAPSSPPKMPTPPFAAPVQSEPEPVQSSGGVPAWIWIVAVILIAALAFFLLKGRA
ncbi:MAG: FHA domain-containing protein [bacterium]